MGFVKKDNQRYYNPIRHAILNHQMINDFTRRESSNWNERRQGQHDVALCAGYDSQTKAAGI